MNFGAPLAMICARHTTLIVLNGKSIYLGVIGLLTWQASRGQPVYAPDAQTLAAFGVLLGMSGTSVAIILAHARIGK